MRLNAFDLQICDYYNTLASQDKLELSEDALELSISEQIYEKYISTSPIVDELYRLGHDIEIKAVLVDSSLAKLQTALNMTSSQKKATGKVLLPRKKLQYKDMLEAGIPEMWKAEKFLIEVDYDEQFQVDEATYLPITFKPKQTATLKKQFLFEIDNDQSTLSTTTIKLKVNDGETVYIDWGDDNIETITGDGTLNTYTHDYSTTGDYQIEIYGFMHHLQTVEITNQDFLSGDIGAIHTLSNLDTFNIFSTGFSYTSLDLINIDTATIDIKDNNLTTPEVDRFLIDLNNAAESGATGDLDISGNNAARSSASDTAVSELSTKGWTITVNT